MLYDNKYGKWHFEEIEMEQNTSSELSIKCSVIFIRFVHVFVAVF